MSDAIHFSLNISAITELFFPVIVFIVKFIPETWSKVNHVLAAVSEANFSDEYIP